MGKLFETPSRLFIAWVVLLSSLIGTHVYERKHRYVSATLLAADAAPSVVVIECNVDYIKDGQKGHNTYTTAGFVASRNGHIITVAHGLTNCTTNQKNIIIRFWEDPTLEYHAVIKRISTYQDVAVLQVPSMPSGVKPLRMERNPPKQGERAVGIGHPELFYWSVGEGIVSADRHWGNPIRHFIQVTTPINPGNSGGPVLNDKGKVIGIASFNIGGNPTLSFLIPIDTIAFFIRGLH